MVLSSSTTLRINLRRNLTNAPQPPHERKQEGDDHESGDDADEAGASAMRAFFQSSLQSAKPLMVSGTVQSVDQTQQLPPLPSGGSLAASLLS